MTKPFFITFGVQYRPVPNSQGYGNPHPLFREAHGDGYVIIHAADDFEARDAAVRLFGHLWSSSYPEDSFEAKWHPVGCLAEVNASDLDRDDLPLWQGAHTMATAEAVRGRLIAIAEHPNWATEDKIAAASEVLVSYGQIDTAMALMDVMKPDVERLRINATGLDGDQFDALLNSLVSAHIGMAGLSVTLNAEAQDAD